MRERPILFNGAMVRAILAGKKIQTRRVVKPAPPASHVWAGWCRSSTCKADEGKAVWAAGEGPLMHNAHRVACPFGQPGERLWVRETFMVEVHPASVGLTREDIPRTWDAAVAAAGNFYYRADPGADYMADGRSWSPSIHMPRKACRLVLEITAVRVERLQAISAQDCIAEGITTRFTVDDGDEDLRIQFRDLWTSTGGDWTGNPWVWVIEFNRINEVPHG